MYFKTRQLSSKCESPKFIDQRYKFETPGKKSITL